MKRLAFAVILSLGYALPAAPATIYFDNFEQFALGADITNVVSSPAVGGPNTARLHPHLGTPTSPTVTAVAFNGTTAAEFSLPVGSGEDYLGSFLTTYVEQSIIVDWQFTALGTNDGLGGFFIRFPTSDPIPDMQVLMGFLDGGRVIVFTDTPSPATAQDIGPYSAGHTYQARLSLDLPSDTYSVWLDGTPRLLNAPIPPHITSAAIHQFGFDSNEHLPTSQGNRFVLDTVQVTVGAQVPEPATVTLLGVGLAGLAMRRRRKSPKLT